MRKLLTILFICLLQNSFAQTTHYISTTGSDANNGTIGSPWKSLYKACNSVLTPGDTIYVNPGNYTETQPANLRVGVSIKGAGRSSTIIISNYKGDWNQADPSDAAIYLVSSSEGTNGNQSISDITLDGNNLYATNAILVKRRSNVSIHDINVKNFYVNGVYFIGGSNPFLKPTIYATGNTVYNAMIDNCTDSSSTWVGGALIGTTGQDGLTVHDCVLSDTSRADGRNGDVVADGKFGKNFKYYNNTSYKKKGSGGWWNFHLEIPNHEGGTEIYNNHFYYGDCAVDVGANDGYDYSLGFLMKIHDNYLEDMPLNNGGRGKCAISMEGPQVINVFIQNNTFNKIARPFGITDGSAGVTRDSNIVITKNLVLNAGIQDAGSYMNLVEITKENANGLVQDLFITNNTITPTTLVNSSAFNFVNHNGGVMKRVTIANNIITGGKNQYWMWVDNTGGTIDSFIVNHNDLFNQPNSAAVSFTGTPVTNYINSGNITSNPLLNTDGSLQSGSPAIGAAYPYGYGVDIGAVQYTVTAPTISMSANQTIAVNNTTISAVGTPASGHTIASYQWTQTQGTGTIGNATSASTPVSNLSSGINKFQCTITQDDGQTASGVVTVTYNAPSNNPPTANAGSDQTITLPTNQVTLTGSGTDSDGSIANYSWSKVSGGAATITSSSSATTTVTGLAAGVYVFRLTVTDNQGATGTDDVQITVVVTPIGQTQFRISKKKRVYK